MISDSIKVFDIEAYNKDTVIGEFSGRDSVAAIMKAFESEDINYILPIATFAGTEYGDFDMLYDNYKKLVQIVEKRYGNKKIVYPLLEYSDFEVWSLMNGRYMAQIASVYGYMTPCIGCHLYFHLTKLWFASNLSGKIISGERESHDGRIKVNQLGICLDLYAEVIAECGCELIMPIRNVEGGDSIEALIGWEWEEGKGHPKCLFSGNYRDCNGKAIYSNEELERYLGEYLKKVGILVGKHILDKEGDIRILSKEVSKLI